MTWSWHLMKVADDVASFADLPDDGPSPLGRIDEVERRLRPFMPERVGDSLVVVLEDAPNGFAVEVSFLQQEGVVTSGTIRAVPRTRAPSREQLVVHARWIATAVGAGVFTDDGERIV